jgi:hypothetical protein
MPRVFSGNFTFQTLPAPVWELSSDAALVMRGWLPALYHRSRVMDNVLQAQGVELDALNLAVAELVDQFYAFTATWALDRWEEELALAPVTGQPLEERRSRVISHLRGYGTATVPVVKNVAAAFVNGEIDVSEDHSVYTVTIHFIDTRGVPPNLADMQAALRAVIPAHLAIAYDFRYYLASEARAEGMTWGDVRALNLTSAQIRARRP